MAARVYIDLVGLDEESARNKLLVGIQRHRAKPTDRPAFPGATALPAAARSVPDQPDFPAHLAVVFNVPFAKNLAFSGRDDLLDRMADAITGQGKAAVLWAVYGLGGVGKTQAAVEYAYRHRGEYDGVWWVRAEAPITLTADYVALATVLGLPEAADDDQAIAVASVRQWLERGERRWLLIFDNAEAYDDLADYLPRRGGHVLVTSRSRNWPPSMMSLEVDVLEPDEAIRLLHKRTGLEDDAGARDLAEALGHLPLALEQAAAYIDQRGLSYAAYLKRFNASRAELLKRGKPDTYPATVATTWELSFQAVIAQTHHAERLMELLPFFAPEAIPLDLLTAHAGMLPLELQETLGDQLALDHAIIALRRFSLVGVHPDDSLSVHRLVQYVMRERLDPTTKQAGVSAAVQVVSSTLAAVGHDRQVWQAADRLLPHALAVIDHGTDLGLTDPQFWRLVTDTGIYLAERARFFEARPLLERSLISGEAELGPDHPELANGFHHLARVLKELARLPEAQGLVERALAIDESTYGADDVEVAADFQLLANILRERGRLAEARAAIDRALEILRCKLGEDHQRVGSCYNDLGLVLKRLGQYQHARRAHERALTIHTAQYPPNHPEIGIDLGNLGEVLLLQGHVEHARSRFEKAHSVHEAWYEPEHPIVAHDLVNLGRVLEAQGDLTGAQKNFDHALRIMEAAFGSDHPSTAGVLGNIAAVLWRLNELEEAEAYYRRVIAIREAVHGPDDASVAAAYGNLALVLHDQGAWDEARSLLERVLRTHRATHGAGHPSEAILLNNLGGVLRSEGKADQAIEAFEAALSIRANNDGLNTPDGVTLLSNLGTLLQEQGQLARAVELLAHGLEVQEVVLGAAHADVAVTLNNLGSVHRSLGQIELAQELYERSLSITDATLGPEHPRAVTTLHNLADMLLQHADVLRRDGHYAEARRSAQRALSLFRRATTTDRVQEALRLLWTITKDERKRRQQ